MRQRTGFFPLESLRAFVGFALLLVSLLGASADPSLKVPEWSGRVKVDGKLDERCYQERPILEQFVVAGQPQQRPPKTKAWLFWQRDRLIFAFECEDADIVAAAPSGKEHDVDDQDRVELFLWSGAPDKPYACIEIGARSAVHDYLARFYRRFDDAWSPAGWEYAVHRTPGGYRVEAALPRAALAALGFHLEAGARWRVGLFRADFSHRSQAGPTWITWVDAKLPQPDFHVAGSFGEIVLQPAKK